MTRNITIHSLDDFFSKVSWEDTRCAFEFTALFTLVEFFFETFSDVIAPVSRPLFIFIQGLHRSAISIIKFLFFEKSFLKNSKLIIA